MTHTPAQTLRTLRGACASIARLLRRKGPEAAIDIDDPIRGALRDAELLIAFAAQSSQGIKPDKVKALAESSAKINAARAAGIVVPGNESSSFWLAYDNLAVDMAPLSAHSIRSSMDINSRLFPGSLLTPTAINAALAVVVFLICLALQGFWVAGKELVERGDKLEKEKIELQKKMTLNASALQRATVREDAINEQLCSLITCGDLSSPSAWLKDKKADASRVAALRTELNLAHSEVAEKVLLNGELTDELAKINDRSRPLENLLRKWHDRARNVCGTWYLKYLCPVDNPAENQGADADPVRELKARQGQLQREMEALKIDYEKARSENSATVRFLSARSINFAKQRELQKVEEDLAKQEADRFHSIAVEVIIILANISTYLIAMVMGLLGALTFLLRSLSQQLREHTYVPVSASVSIVRICLGAISGVFGSLVVPGADSTLKSLPPLFIPFVFGYGIEILFSLLDKVVRNFTQAEQPPSQRNSAG